MLPSVIDQQPFSEHIVLPCCSWPFFCEHLTVLPRADRVCTQCAIADELHMIVGCPALKISAINKAADYAAKYCWGKVQLVCSPQTATPRCPLICATWPYADFLCCSELPEFSTEVNVLAPSIMLLVLQLRLGAALSNAIVNLVLHMLYNFVPSTSSSTKLSGL